MFANIFYRVEIISAKFKYKTVWYTKMKKTNLVTWHTCIKLCFKTRMFFRGHKLNPHCIACTLNDRTSLHLTDFSDQHSFSIVEVNIGRVAILVFEILIEWKRDQASFRYLWKKRKPIKTKEIDRILKYWHIRYIKQMLYLDVPNTISSLWCFPRVERRD